jgi:hypothetical protein
MKGLGKHMAICGFFVAVAIVLVATATSVAISSRLRPAS